MTPRVYLARWVLPIATPPIPDGAVAVDGDRIAWVGPGREAPPGVVVDLGNVVLVPGLVNTHCHLELTAMRGYLEDLPFRQWILRLTKSREAVMTRERRLAAARVGLAEGLLSGITTYADVSDSGVSLDAMARMGVRGTCYHEVFGPHPAQCEAAIAALRQAAVDLCARATPLVGVGLSPHAPYTVSDDLFRATAVLARELDLPLTVHAAEGEAEDALVRRGAGEFADAWRARGIPVTPRSRSPIQLLADTGVLGPRTLVVHAVHADGEDRALLEATGSAVAHCPASNAKLGHGVAPLMELLGDAVRVGLGSDSVASGNRMDLLEDARLAILQQRARLRDPVVLSASAMLHCATAGGAAALGLDQAIGALRPGMQADLAAFRLDDPSDIPTFGPEDALVFGRGGRRAALTVVAGRELVREGRLLADLQPDRDLVEETAAALRELGGDPSRNVGPIR